MNSTQDLKLEEQTVLILPHFIKSLWTKTEPLLLQMTKTQLPNIFDFLEILNFFISQHYHPKKSLNIKNFLRFIETFTPEEISYFLKTFIPLISKLALNIKDLFPNSIKLFKQNQDSSLQFSKKQIACLISHMFLCTFHHQNSPKLPKFCNFTYLFHEDETSRIQMKISKLQCFYNYLKRTLVKLPELNGLVIYQRLVFDPLTHKTSQLNAEYWLKSKNALAAYSFNSKKTIEDANPELYIQTIFANKLIGGGVLSNGGLQEEIRIAISPEMLPALLLFEELEDYEAVLYLGCEKYNMINFYSDKLKYEGDFQDKTDFDVFEKRDIAILGIDAFNFQDSREQYRLNMILRELNKAFIGFYGSELIKDKPRKAIATGKWGCGDFKGDFQLKLAIQWLAASECGREVHFFFKEEDLLIQEYEDFCKRMKGNSVGEVFGYLKEYSRMVSQENVEISLFEFVKDFIE